MDELLKIKAFANREAIPIMQDEGCDFICDYILKNNSTEEEFREKCRSKFLEVLTDGCY